VGNRNLLIAGQLDFYMGGNLIEPFNAVKEGIPTIVVAAIFQKEPQVLLAHPDQGVEEFEDLAKLDTLFLSNYGFITFFQWMLSEYPQFREEQHRPYAFNPTPFIVDPNSAQQGYVTSEPYQIEREAGWTPRIFLLADHGFDTYSTLIETRRELVEESPEIVQRFVDASIIGWYTYLYGDNSAGNALIKEQNPEMTDELIAYSLDKMKEYGIVDSGEARELGIGCMTEARVRSFFERMVRAGVTDGNIDPREAFTADFVCRGVGLDRRADLADD
jgi:NitT/TauT family transport system substrate-binding protein